MIAMTNRFLLLSVLAASLTLCRAFVVLPVTPSHTITLTARARFPTASPCSNQDCQHRHSSRNSSNDKQKKVSFWKRLGRRLNTIESAGYEPDQVLTAGLFGPIKKAYNPITFLVLAFLAGLKWNWCFRNPYYWFAVGFCIKWYRARYVFKIPVWDRQPNWNNIITSKEQEKDLKAFTCKNCGSTLFIAKTREFFFEGNTGIGGLGCFTCGAKGKDNFVQDRDRIVEDVADIDDYFEYERPLDFVSAAERRKLLKEAAGDEERANQLLLERETTAAGVTDAEVLGKTVTGEDDSLVVDEPMEEEPVAEDNSSVADELMKEEPVAEEPVPEEVAPEVEEELEEEEKQVDKPVAKEPKAEKIEEPKAATEKAPATKKTGKKKKAAPKKSTPPPPPPAIDDDDDLMALLDMD